MKNLRKNFERFCYKNRNRGIPNLMLYIVIGSGLVYLLSLMNGGNAIYNLLIFDKTKILQGQVWRLFSYVFTYEIGSNPILVIISLYCFYYLGKTIENMWGTFRFNLFYLGGIILMDIFAMLFCPTIPSELTAENAAVYYEAVAFQVFYESRMVYYLNLTLLISFATLFPDAQFIIMFILPVKAWIMGLLYLVLTFVELYNLCIPDFLFPHCLFPLVGFANYLLFFGKDIANLLPFGLRVKLAGKSAKAYRHEKQSPIPFRPANKASERKSEQVNYTHRCSVCGRTDISNPELEFRYCSRCKGYHCYCEDHISNHTHNE